jgi:hypothetical protein
LDHNNEWEALVCLASVSHDSAGWRHTVQLLSGVHKRLPLWR